MGPYQVLPFRVRVDLKIMPMKMGLYSPHSPRTEASPFFNHTRDIPFLKSGFYPSAADTDNVFKDPPIKGLKPRIKVLEVV